MSRSRVTPLTLGLLLLWSVVPALADCPAGPESPNPIDSCGIQDGMGSIILDDPPSCGSRGQGAVTVFVRKTEVPEVRIDCSYRVKSGSTELHQALGAPKTTQISSDTLAMSVSPGQMVRPTVKNMAPFGVIPVHTGENQVTVTFRHPQYPGQLSRTVTFTAWVYTVEPWGQLENPFKRKLSYSNIDPRLVDTDGNLYASLWGNQERTHWYGIVKYGPGGKLVARYETGVLDDTGLGQHPTEPLFVTQDKHLYAQTYIDVARFDPTGKFVRGITGLGEGYGPAKSVADLDMKPGRVYNQKNPNAQISRFINPHQAPIMEGAAYLLARTEPPNVRANSGQTQYSLVRVTADGKITILDSLGLVNQLREPSGPVLGPDGQLYSYFERDKKKVLLIHSPKGTRVKELIDPFPRNSEHLLGIESDGGFIIGSFKNFCQRISPDFALYNENLPDQRVVARTWQPPYDSWASRMDILTGESVPPRGEKADQMSRKGCLVANGSIYILYQDNQVAKLTLQISGPAPTQQALPSMPTLSIRLGPEDRIVLDGAKRVNLEACLKDPKGNPMPGVEVTFSANDRDLPKRGRIEYPEGASRTTDTKGCATGFYVPPLVRDKDLGQQGGLTLEDRRRPLIIAFEARAALKGQAPLEASANATAFPLLDALFKISRRGYATVEKIPALIPSLRGGIVTGTAVHKPQGTGQGGGTAQTFGFPVAGATVELMDLDGKPLGAVATNADGSFTIDFRTEGGASRPNKLLGDELVFTQYEPEVENQVSRTRVALRAMEAGTISGSQERYDYRTGGLLAALDDHFPMRLAAAAKDQAIDMELDRLERVGLLVVSLRATHDLTQHAATRFSDSLGDMVDGISGILVDKFNPLGAKAQLGAKEYRLGEQVGGVAASATGAGAAKAALLTPMRWKTAHFVVAKLSAGLTSKVGQDALTAGYEIAAWEKAKNLLAEAIANGNEGWKPSLASLLTDSCRNLGQAELDRARDLWTRDAIPYSGSPIGPIVRQRYAEVAAHKQAVADQQLQWDLFKTNVRQGLDLLQKSATVIAAATAGPVAAQEMSEGLGKFQTALEAFGAAADAYQGYQWWKDWGTGIRAIRQFGETALGPAVGETALRAP